MTIKMIEMDYHEYLKNRQLIKKIYHDIGASRKAGNVAALNYIEATIVQWLRSINNPKLYYVYESHEYLSNPYLVRLRKEFPDLLRLVELAKKDIKNKATKVAARKFVEEPKKEDKNAADISIKEEI